MAGINVLKWVEMPKFGIQSVSINTDTIRILTIRFRYKEKLKEKKNHDVYLTFSLFKALQIKNIVLEEKNSYFQKTQQ